MHFSCNTSSAARAVIADIMGQDIDSYSVETMNRQNIISPGRFALEEGYHRHRRHNGRHDVEVVVQLAQNLDYLSLHTT